MDLPNEAMREVTPQENNMETLIAQVQELTRQMGSLPQVFERLGRLEQSPPSVVLEGIPSPQPEVHSEIEPNEPRSKNDPQVALYKELGERVSLARTSIKRPIEFSGDDCIENPYALTYWWDEVLCWVVSFTKDPGAQLVFAIDTLTGSAASMVRHRIKEDRDALRTIDDLYGLLKKAYQTRDPGPQALNEFRLARQRINETPIQLLNRIRRLTFVINDSRDPQCFHIDGQTLAERFRMALKIPIQRSISRHHELLIELGKTPDLSVDGMAALAMKLDADYKSQQLLRSKREKLTDYPGQLASLPSKPNSKTTSSAKKEFEPSSRQRKPFRQLTKQQQVNIINAQKHLAANRPAVTDPLSAELQQLCMQNGLCQKCHSYGHDTTRCTASTIFKPKN